MATLHEIRELEVAALTPVDRGVDPVIISPEQELFGKVQAAVWIKATSLLSGAETPSTDKEYNESVWWAQRAVNSPATSIFRLVLAENASFDVATILSASDAQIQTAIDNVLSRLVHGTRP